MQRKVYDNETKFTCISMRKEGFSIGLISKATGVLYFTVRSWVKDIPIEGNLQRIPVSRRRKNFDECSGKKTRKRFLIEERGRKCEVCCLLEWMNKPIPLEIHHIDGNNQNWIKVNLLLCCPNCHSFTETYRGKNKALKRKQKMSV